LFITISQEGCNKKLVLKVSNPVHIQIKNCSGNNNISRITISALATSKINIQSATLLVGCAAYSGAALINTFAPKRGAYLVVAFIQGWRLFEGSTLSSKYGKQFGPTMF